MQVIMVVAREQPALLVPDASGSARPVRRRGRTEQISNRKAEALFGRATALASPLGRFVYRSDNARRDPACDDPRRDLPVYDGVRGDDGALSDPRALENPNASADPDLGSDMHGLCHRRPFLQSLFGRQMMVLVADGAMFGDEGIGADLEQLDSHQDRIPPNENAITEHQPSPPAHLERAAIAERMTSSPISRSPVKEHDELCTFPHTHKPRPPRMTPRHQDPSGEASRAHRHGSRPVVGTLHQPAQERHDL